MRAPGFEIGARLHDGHDTTLFRATRERDGRAVVLKVFRGARSAEAEREHLVAVAGDGAPPLLDVVETDEGPALVLPFASGGSLKDLLGGGPVPLARALTAGASVARVLARAHAAGVLHRDVKPSNVLFADGVVWLSDWGLATRVGENGTVAATALVGSPRYVSPEQTGRTGRDVDARADLYSLGALLYESLSGRPPFVDTDAAALVAAHVARTPEPLAQVAPWVPAMVEQIVMRLLAKDPVDRYQSAAGLATDLETCVSAWERDKSIPSFELGTADHVEPRLADVLAGRESAQRALRDASIQVEEGGSRLVVIASEGGLGKTALLDDLARSLPEPWIVLTAAFADAAQPLDGIRAVLDGLARVFCEMSDAELRHWQRRVHDAVGNTASALIELSPDFAAVVGDAPPLAGVGLVEARARLELALRRVVEIVARARPLAVLLDDVHRADEASRKLIPALLGGDSAAVLAVVTTDPNALPTELSGRDAVRIELSPLDEAAVETLLARWLGVDAERAAPLATVVFRKTHGRPGDVRALLLHLLATGRVQKTKAGCTWSLEEVEAATVPRELAARIESRWPELPDTEQRVLLALTCAGAPLKASEVTAASGLAASVTENALGRLVSEGLASAFGEAFGLAHRTMADAIRERVPATDREAIHGRLARHWLTSLDAATRTERIVEIATHLARGPKTEGATRKRDAALLLEAGRRAVRALAYELGDELMSRVLELLPDEDEDARTAAAIELARTRICRGHHREAEALLATVAKGRLTPKDAAELYTIRIEALSMAETDKALAVRVGLEGLAKLGLEIPARPGPIRPLLLMLANERKLTKLLEKGIDKATAADDPLALARMQLLLVASAPAYTFDPNLVLLFLQRTLQVLLENGLTSTTAYVLASHALVISGAFGKWERAEQLVDLAIKLSERYPDEPTAPRTQVAIHGFVTPWRRAPAESSRALELASRKAYDRGDVQWGNYGAAMALMIGSHAGRSLHELAKISQQHAREGSRFGDKDVASVSILQAKLLGAAAAGDPLPLGATRELLTELQARGSTVAAESFLVHDGPVLFVNGHLDVLALILTSSKPAWYEKRNFGLITVQDYHVLRGLVAAERALGGDKSAMKILETSRKRIGVLQKKSGSGTEALALVLRAEEAVLAGKVAEACALYGAAAAAADRRGNRKWVAIAHDRRAMCLARTGYQAEARIFRREAHAAYERWGHRARARQMEAEWPELALAAPSGADLSIGSTTSATTSASSGTQKSHGSSNEAFDMSAVVRATQAVSRELTVDGVLRAVMEAACAASGAGRAVLVLSSEDEPVIEARLLGGIFARVHEPLSKSDDVPQPLVRSVLRRGRPIVVSDAQKSANLRDDPAVRASGARSILCMPMVRQGATVGALLLENALLTGAFTESRVRVLDVLVGQAAISLDNAALYTTLEGRVADRTKSLDERNRAMRLLLDSVDQGFLMVDREGRLAEERSAVVDTWLGVASGEAPSRGTFVELLGRADEAAAAWFAVAFDQLKEGALPASVCLTQLPSRATLGARIVDLRYRLIPEDADDLWDRVLVIMTDVTAAVERAALERRQGEVLTIFERVVKDPEGFLEFVAEASNIVGRLEAQSGTKESERIDVHTLKGTCALLGIFSVAQACDEVETALGQEDRALTDDERAALVSAWRRVEAEVARFLPEQKDEVRLTSADLDALVERLDGLDRELARSVRSLRHERAERRLARLGEQARSLAARLGKGELEVVIEDHGVRIEPGPFGTFWASLVHGVRNAVDHGLETPDERVRTDKPPRGRLRLSSWIEGETLFVVLEDDGRGVDWAAVRARAETLGMPAGDEAELVHALFSERFSTRARATDISGRGLGMAAMREAAEALGGRVELTSTAGRGTRLLFRFPRPGSATSRARLRSLRPEPVTEVRAAGVSGGAA